MVTYGSKVITNTVNKLIRGEDYREEVINSINLLFFDEALIFFKEIVAAKLDSKTIGMDWYKEHFIINDDLSPDSRVIHAGLNRKTVTNINGSGTREIMIKAAEDNYDYLTGVISELEDDVENGIQLKIKISYNEVSVELNLSESMLVINALATKKIAIRGGAWSSIGKKVEKPLIDELCRQCGVPKENINNSNFKKDHSKKVDREVDYKLISRKGVVYRIEVKLMGKGNPESADAIIARDTNIFIADTMSQQNKNQCEAIGCKWLMMKNNSNTIENFKKILFELDIPFKK